MQMSPFAIGRFGSVLLIAGALAPPVLALPVSGQGTWETTLHARDLDGNLANGAEAYYDSSLNVTWLKDAFQARTSGYQARSFYAPGDPLIWPLAVEWAENLSLYGITDWRLPKSFDTGTPGCAHVPSGGECGWNVDPFSSELAHMFHETLGNISYLTPSGTVASGYGVTNTANFDNVYEAYYWSETDFNADVAWNFNFGFGDQSLQVKTVQGSAVWAVLDGDRGRSLAANPPPPPPPPVSAVPEPSTYAMMALGLIAVAGMRRSALKSAR